MHAFQYDAWGRVVQINRAHLEPLIDSHFGDPPSAPHMFIFLEELVKHYTYDAFGRLIRVQSPWPEPGEWSQDLRSERLYYDGLRRVQEIIIDPLLPMSMALSGEGGSQLQSAANQVAFNAEAPLDGAATPATLEYLTLEGENMPATVTTLHREYIWGPGDAWGWGVDELLVQYDQGRCASWPPRELAAARVGRRASWPPRELAAAGRRGRCHRPLRSGWNQRHRPVHCGRRERDTCASCSASIDSVVGSHFPRWCLPCTAATELLVQPLYCVSTLCLGCSRAHFCIE